MSQNAYYNTTNKTLALEEDVIDTILDNSGNKIGTILNGDIITTSCPHSSTPTNIASITLTEGSWVLMGRVCFPYTAVANSAALRSVGITYDGAENKGYQASRYATSDGPTYMTAFSNFDVTDSSQTFYLNARQLNSSSTTLTLNSIYFYAWRIG